MPTRLFLALEALLYAAFLLLDFTLPGSAMLSGGLKYAGVLLCFFWLCTRRLAPGARLWAPLAAAATLGADALLLFTPCLVPGILVFCPAHLLRLRIWQPRWLRWGLPLYALLLAALAAAHLAGLSLPAFPAAAGVYAVLLLAACIAAFLSGGSRLAAGGMLLFILCDICVLLYNTLPATAALYTPARLLMWVFYLPSQVCLTLSFRENKPQ